MQSHNKVENKTVKLKECNNLVNIGIEDRWNYARDIMRTTAEETLKKAK